MAAAFAFVALLAGLAGTRASEPAAGTAELPLHFEANLGQADPSVRYLARTGGTVNYLTDTGLVSVPAADPGARPLRMRFLGAAPGPRVQAHERTPGVVNYLFGADPAAWVTGVPTFGHVRYEGLYPGVDALFRDDGGKLAYDFILAAGADPGAIRLRFEGADAVAVDPQGDLVVTTPHGRIRQSRPVAYQRSGGRRRGVEVSFAVSEGGTVGFDVGAHDPALPLVIDPTLTYASYLTGSGTDTANAVAVDETGAAYVAGRTSSADFPATGGASSGTRPGSTAAFVAKVAPDGSGLVYATYLGGSGSDFAEGVALDGDGAAYVTGTTTSSDFPTQGALQDSLGGNTDAFATKLAPDGSALVYSTYLGGSSADRGSAIAVDGSGAAHVTGTTASTNLPTQDAVQLGLGGGTDAFLAKLAPDGTALAYGTYLGGSADDQAHDVAVGPDGSAYLTGDTASANFPATAGAAQDEQPGPVAAFVARYAPDGSGLVYATYLGGSLTAWLGDPLATGQGVAVDGDGAAHVAGHTTYDDFPTVAALQDERGGDHDMFVTKLAPDGAAFTYSTYLGGPSNDNAADIALDADGSAHVAGLSSAGGFPTVLPVAPYGGNEDPVLARLSPDGSALEYATYLGGSATDSARGIAVHEATGTAYVVGVANEFGSHDDFPTTAGAFQPDRAGVESEGFVTRIAAPDTDAPLVTGLAPRSGPAAGATAVTITGTGFTEDAGVAFGDVPAAEVRVLSGTELLALSPAGELGDVHVTVTTAAGTSPENPAAVFAYAEGVWRPTGPMSEPRSIHSETLLDDGRVLVAGGRTAAGSPALSSAEVYDPATDTWEPTGALGTARAGHSASLLPDGRVLVAGGFASGGPQQDQAILLTTELYDPATGQWSPGPLLDTRRAGHAAVVLGDGRVLVAGGRTCAAPPQTCALTVRTRTAELYDPVAGTWTPTGSLTRERHRFPAVRLDDGRVMAVGGLGSSLLDSVEVYDPSTGEWTATGDLVVPRSRNTADVLADGRVLTTGGFNDYRTAELYDPVTGEWTRTDDLATGRFNHYSAVLPSGDVLVAAGGMGGAHAELFDPETGRWRSAGMLGTALGTSQAPGQGRAHEGIVLGDGSVLVIGNSDQPVAERYVQFPDPETLPGGGEACPPEEVEPAPFSDRALVPEAHRGNVDCAAWNGVVTGFTDGTYGPSLQVRRDQMASFIARTLAAAGVDLPGPAAPFSDVDAGSPHADNIQRLAAAGIVQGGPGALPATAYGPDQHVRRDQMASFLVRAGEYAVGRTLSSNQAAFPDVPDGNPHFGNVNGAALLDLAQGFGDGTYRPGEGVRRDQMATFVVRLLAALVEGPLAS